MKRILLGAVAGLMVTTLCSAAPLVDFSNGTTGNLGTFTTTIGGIQIDAVGGNLFRFDEAIICCAHVDNGLGILGANENPNSAADPEIDRVGGTQEFMRLYNTTGLALTGIWFTSVNNASNLSIYPNMFPVGSFYTMQTSMANGQAIGYLPINPADQFKPFFWITPGGQASDNYTLVWGVDLARETVPEPTTITLLGLGLVGLARKVKRAHS